MTGLETEAVNGLTQKRCSQHWIISKASTLLPVHKSRADQHEKSCPLPERIRQAKQQSFVSGHLPTEGHHQAPHFRRVHPCPDRSFCSLLRIGIDHWVKYVLQHVSVHWLLKGHDPCTFVDQGTYVSCLWALVLAHAACDIRTYLCFRYLLLQIDPGGDGTFDLFERHTSKLAPIQPSPDRQVAEVPERKCGRCALPKRKQVQKERELCMRPPGVRTASWPDAHLGLSHQSSLDPFVKATLRDRKTVPRGAR